MTSHFKIVNLYSVLRVVFCLWYICFTCFCGILWYDVLWSSPLHYLLLFAKKFRIVLVSCDLEANRNAYPMILIYSCECCHKQIQLLCNFWVWLVLVSADAPMILICFLLIFIFRHCRKSHQLLILLLMLQHVEVFYIRLILHHS